MTPREIELLYFLASSPNQDVYKRQAYNLEKQLSQLCYVGDGTLYIMMNNTIYYANLKTKEWGALVENVEDGSFAINSDGSMLAYNTSGKAYDTESITIVNLKNGEKKTIEAGADNIITVYGYTGTNLIYGIGSQSDVSKESFVPVSKLVIVDKDYKEVKSYSQNKIYITGVEITDNIINIKRYKGCLLYTSTYCMGVLLDLKGKKMYTSSYQYEMDYNPEGYAFNLISYENIGGKNDNIK